MQIGPEELNAIIGAIAGAGTSILSAFVTHGIITEKVRRLEEDLKALKVEQNEFVTYKHLDAVVEPLRKTLDTVQEDVKEILRAVSKVAP